MDIISKTEIYEYSGFQMVMSVCSVLLIFYIFQGHMLEMFLANHRVILLITYILFLVYPVLVLFMLTKTDVTTPGFCRKPSGKYIYTVKTDGTNLLDTIGEEYTIINYNSENGTLLIRDK